MTEETTKQGAERYERALRACVEDVLDGGEAECWNCGTVVHDGPCVADEEDPTA